jgi:ABC-type Fe3+-siderophore transport system permease subunit
MGYLFVSLLSPKISLIDVVFLSTVFSFIAFIILFIFFKGQSKEPDSQTLHILVAVSLKFLLEIVFALIWFIVAKKNSLPSVLMFFVLYLTLSLFTIWVLVKTLKNKALLNRN